MSPTSIPTRISPIPPSASILRALIGANEIMRALKAAVFPPGEGFVIRNDPRFEAPIELFSGCLSSRRPGRQTKLPGFV